MTTIIQARDDIIETFYNAWVSDSASSGVKLFFDNKDEDESQKDSTKSWARISIRHFDTFDTESLSGGLGQKDYPRSGVVIVNIFTPVVDGMETDSALIEIAVTSFEGVRTENNVWFRNVRFSEVGVSGAWFQTNVKANFNYSEVK